MATPKFKYRDTEIPIEITWSDATKKLDDLGIDILNILNDGDAVIANIMLNDRVMLKVWYHYVNQHTGDNFDDAIENLTSRDMNHFKEQFWEAVILFSNPLARELLRNAWVEAKKQVRSKAKNLGSSSSDSLEEQE